MKLTGGSSRSPIGLDVGARPVKAIQLSRSGSDWKISAATLFPRALPDAAISSSEVRRMIDVLYRHNFFGRDVVISAPPLRLLDGTLELPKAADPSGLDQIARLEFARLQKCEPNALEMGYWSLPAGPRTHQAHRVMAVGCLHRDVEPLLENFESEGLRVVAMDVEACALTRACASRIDSERGLVGLLDFGWNCCRLAVIYQGTVVFARVLNDSGLASLFKSVEKHLDIDTSMADHVLKERGLTQPAPGSEDLLADARGGIRSHFGAMAQELNISFSYATQQYPDAALQRVLVTGGGARIAGVSERLTTILGVETTAVAPTDLTATSGALVELCASPALTLALGLARFCDE
jgi:type IV pilus assembly protein PilM